MRPSIVSILVCAAFLALPALGHAAPKPVRAWYMYATTARGLEATAYRHGCYFAQHHPVGNRLMVLDYGAARKITARTYGALDFSGVRFGNPDILSALEAAANGHHNCYTGVGGTIVSYGNSNYHLAASGMTRLDAWRVGYFQSTRAKQLSDYERAHGYNRQSAAAASDMEPAWDGPVITRQLVRGDSAHGWSLYYDYGSADGCPTGGSGGSCVNGWSVGDVANVSYPGAAVPLPEIYYTANADQWTVVRRWWNAHSSHRYRFWGTTGTTHVGLTPRGGWNALNVRNPRLVLPELNCFC